MLWRSDATTPGGTTGAHTGLSDQILILSGATVVAALLLAVRYFGLGAGLRLLGTFLWPTFLVAFVLALVTGFPLRVIVSPDHFWFVLGPLYGIAVAAIVWWAARAPRTGNLGSG